MAGMIRVARLFMKTPAQGAATSVYLASSPEVEGHRPVLRQPQTPTSSKAAVSIASTCSGLRL